MPSGEGTTGSRIGPGSWARNPGARPPQAPWSHSGGAPPDTGAGTYALRIPHPQRHNCRVAGGLISSAPRSGDRPTDLFISYSPADERWATWVAWELESAGYRTMLQAWDFVPGTNFIDFMDRGIRESAAMIAILSRNYLNSTYGRWEWQSAIRADPDNPARKLVTIRVDECPLEGLLSTITYVDLVGVTDPGEARAMLMARIRHALAGRAKPGQGPDFPNAQAGTPGGVIASPGRDAPTAPGGGAGWGRAARLAWGRAAGLALGPGGRVCPSTRAPGARPRGRPATHPRPRPRSSRDRSSRCSMCPARDSAAG